MTDQTAAPRPVPTFADRTAALEELRAERVKTGRLEGDLRSQTRAVREALAARDEAARICGEAGIEIYRLRAELDEARAELRHVGQVLTDWRRAFTEEPAHEADRVLVDLIDAGLVPTAAALGSPRRAQEEPTAEAEEVARLWHHTVQRLRYGRMTKERLWVSLPEEERALLVEVAGKLLAWLGSPSRAQEATEPPSSCPETVWDGPYSYRCSRGALDGVCATHGRFRPAEREG